MKKEEFLVWKSPEKDVFIHDGQRVFLPEGWVQIPRGDAGLTRRLKAAGEYRVLVHMRRNRMEAVGLWVPEEIANRVRAELEKERSDPAWQKKLNASRRMRERKQAEYEKEFREAVLKFLAFDEKWSAFAERFADAVTAHAVPVGSGTVARTQRIPLEQRAEAAVIAWMRHQTTAYDRMSIARIKGERREARRRLAEHSRRLLAQYRSGEEVDALRCPLARALRQQEASCREDDARGRV